MSTPAFTEPLRASVIDGEVVITGPGSIYGAFEPEAALASAQALLQAHREAVEQLRLAARNDSGSSRAAM